MRTRSTLAWLMLSLAACGRLAFDATLDGSQGTVAPGCLTTELPGPFSADFALGVPAWGTPYNQPSIGLAFLDGAMEITPAGSPAPSYGGMISPNGDFRSRRVFVDVPVMVDTATDAQVGIAIDRAAPDDFGAALHQHGGRLFAEINVNSVLDTTQVAFDPVAHRWWQIREQSGILLFEVSPTGVVWTTIAQKPTPAFLSDARIELFAGVYRIEVDPVGNARFDNLYDCLAP